MTSDLLHVVMHGRVVADLTRTGRKVRLRYLDSDAPALSVSMPPRRSRHQHAAISPWLDGLLPDDPALILAWRRRLGIASSETFDLLAHVGEDVAGAAQFVRPDRVDAVLSRVGSATVLSDNDIAERLSLALASRPAWPAGDQGKFSLAGAQAKIALQRRDGHWFDPDGSEPSTHIVKPAIPRLADQDLVEFVTMRLAKEAGLQTHPVKVSEFGGQRALVVTRYDRVRRGDRWLRIHQEDMCQALGRSPSRKYERDGGPGAADIAALLREHSSDADEDIRRFAQRLVFNQLVCGTDAHARNYALLLSGDQIRLAPAYDLNSFLAYSDNTDHELSMRIGQQYLASRVTADDWRDCAAQVGVPAAWLRDEVDRQREVLRASVSDAVSEPDVAMFASDVLERLADNLMRTLKETRKQV